MEYLPQQEAPNEPSAKTLPSFCSSFESYQAKIQQQCQVLEVPFPEPQAIRLSYQLAVKTCQDIAADQPIPFADFMQRALYQPGLGYYSAGSRKFGQAGDFITAPEVSELFAHTLADSFIDAFTVVERNILELGAGSGIFLCHLLSQLEKRQELPLKYYVLEVSADLKQRQQQTAKQWIPHLFDRIEWLNRLPENFKGMIYGNEVVDALPVDLYKKQGSGLQKAYIDFSDEGFHKVWKPCEIPQDLNQYFARWPEGYITEYSKLREDWMESLCDCVEQGVILLSDYGYQQNDFYSPERSRGTLQCYYRHHKHEQLTCLLGLQDITASVDFTQLALASDNKGAQIEGFTNQSLFLLASGLAEHENQFAQQDESDTIASLTKAQQLKTLIMPNEMGESIKFIAINQRHLPLKFFAIFDILTA